MATSEPFDRYLRTPEAARLLGLSPRTLEKHRTFGTGPVYRKLGGRIVYAPEDLRAWAERGRRSSTSDPGEDTILPARPKSVSRPAARRLKRTKKKPARKAPRPRKR